MVATQKFFYDGQIERFLAQFIRIVSGFQVEYGTDREGNRALQRVPVYYGDGSRQAAAILANNSTNVMPAVPAMTVYINGVTYDRDRVQEPTFVGKMQIRQKYYNEDTQEYENRQGNAFSIERSMPIPYTLELKLDVWTSNTKQKLQLLEQIIPLFNPAMEIQSTDNYIDWTSLTAVYLESPNWTSRSVPIGTSDPVDVATLTFKLPIWISPPAKITKLGVIQRIVASIFDVNGDVSLENYNEGEQIARLYYTPLDYGVLLMGNTLTLLKRQDIEIPNEPNLDISVKLGSKDTWPGLVGMYGVLQNGISQIRLQLDDGVSEIIGTVSYHPTDPTQLIFNADIDTYPSNTLSPINAIIDPHKVDVDSMLLSPVTGTRYLILHAIGSFNNTYQDDAIAWRGIDEQPLIANANDIIEWTGEHWAVVFDSQSSDSVQYVSNLTTGTQYKWNLNQWVKSYEGEYKSGLWSIVL